MNKIKICGLTRTDDIDAVNEVLPEYIGFVFAESKREVSIKRATYLKSLLSPQIKSVGVFVNAQIDKIAECVDSGTIDLIQLHGDEDHNYIIHLSEVITLPIIKAVRVKEKGDIKKAEKIDADFLLYDKYTEGVYGGTGQMFDWSLLKKAHRPYFLAGGVSEENLHYALKYNPYCIDVSSSVETDGVKDIEKIKNIVKAIRGDRNGEF